MSLFNFNSFSTPPRKGGLNATSPTSPLPFCTSPNDLDNALKDSSRDIDKSTVCGKNTGSRSVKEFEEQLSSLKKENFNLKLRIYFLEEKLGVNFTLDEDNALKKNIELKVEIANLQKDLQEKHDLLCQAVKAMELEDEDHKKYVQMKEDQFNQFQQEIEELRMQVNDCKYDDGLSHRSDPTGLIFNRVYPLQDTDSNSNFRELQEKCRSLERELQCEKENSLSLQILLDQQKSFKQKLELAEEKNKEKDVEISELKDELTRVTEKYKEYNVLIKDLEGKLVQSNNDNQNLLKKMEEDSAVTEQLMGQVSELKKKYSNLKLEIEREHKKAERSKMFGDIKISELESENEKYRTKVRELTAKLEIAQNESKKNQNLAVPSCQVQNTNTSHTDDHFSDSYPATPNRTPQKDALSVSLKSSRTTITPEKFDLSQLEQLLLGAGESATVQQILSGVNSLKSDHSVQKQKIIKLKAEQIKACEIIKSMIESRNKATEEIGQLKKRCDEQELKLQMLASNSDKNSKMPLHQRVSEMKITAGIPDNEKSMAESQNEDLVEQYKALSDELEAKIEVLKATLDVKDSQLFSLKVQYEEALKMLSEKDNELIDLEYEILSRDQNESNNHDQSTEKADLGTEKYKECYIEELDKKNKEIERLNAELKKVNCYLQEIVNKELWEKNREIEKMHNKQTSTTEVTKLRKELQSKDSQLKLLKDKICELGLDIPVPGSGDTDANKVDVCHCNISENEKGNLQIQLRNGSVYKEMESVEEKNSALLEELSQYKQLYHETNEVSSILSTRLEELAVFLDTLLKQKSVLGFLGFHRNKKLREIIDNSLELSRSFTLSLIVNPEQSLTQLSNITTLLNGSILQELSLNNLEEDSILSINPGQVTLTYQSHLYKQNACLDDVGQERQLICALREQVNNLQHELQLRDHELSRLNNIRELSDKMTDTTEQGSAKEFVDKSCQKSQLLKLSYNSKTKKSHSFTHATSENQSESEAWSEPDTHVSKQRIGLNNTMPNIAIKRTDMSTDDSLSEAAFSRFYSRNVFDLHKQIQQLKDELQAKNLELLDTQHKVEEHIHQLESKVKLAEEKCADYEAKVEEVQQQLVEVTQAKTQLQESMVTKDKEMQEIINQLEVERGSLLKSVEKFEAETNEAKNELKINESKLTKVNEEWELFKINLRKDYEEYTFKKLKNAEEEYLKKLEIANKAAESKVSDMKSQIREIEDISEKKIKETEEAYVNKIKEIEDTFAKNYVEKVELEKAISEREGMIREIDGLRNEITKFKETLDRHQSKEGELKQIIDSMQISLNNKEVQNSEILLENAKITNQKAAVEQELSLIAAKEADMKEQFREIQAELGSLKHNYQQQCTVLQSQKSKLELKVSELESINAEFHNRLTRLQVTGNCNLNISMPGSLPNRTLDEHFFYKRQCSNDGDDLRPFHHIVPQAVRPVDFERQEANSSPDLGIESDHGRFSSLETHSTVPRPILQTIELTESMNNLLDDENNQCDDINCENERCCQKIMDFAKENNELKKRLLRMKRALEETATQLSLANQRKKQVEKTICRQIHKTSQVLRKAKANLDSGSESDVLKK